MTESKIRVLFFSLGATAVWVLLAWLVVIALFLTVLAMGQSS